jgi:hypothetical protein
LILCSRKLLRSKCECLKPFNCSSSSRRSLERALLCNVESNEVSFRQLPLLFLIVGRQPSGGTLINANFLPPNLYISCQISIDTSLDIYVNGIQKIQICIRSLEGNCTYFNHCCQVADDHPNVFGVCV